METIKALIAQATSATKVTKLESIQNLWSGYGEIARYLLEGAEAETIIVKHIKLPSKNQHPRGWNTDISHQRKITSYQVEIAWYQQWSKYCSSKCRVPICLDTKSSKNEMYILLEDLDSSGFNIRKEQISNQDIKACLSWLANFHASFMQQSPTNLWPVGTYWHLSTRPDELAALTDKTLKNTATLIDQELNSCQFKTFVHGDAKLANFCFSPEINHAVAAVDFQYVGGGCGMKDVAYFLGSCLNDQQCQQQQESLLDFYFAALKSALINCHSSVDPRAVEIEWRYLYPIAWTDFHRFIKGWSPSHWKINSYSERLAKQVTQQLKGK